jgi:hypothetical protein
MPWGIAHSMIVGRLHSFIALLIRCSGPDVRCDLTTASNRSILGRYFSAEPARRPDACSGVGTGCVFDDCWCCGGVSRDGFTGQVRRC